MWPIGFAQPVTEMSTRILPEGKRRPAREADNLIAIYEATVGASTSCYRDNCTFYALDVLRNAVSDYVTLPISLLDFDQIWNISTKFGIPLECHVLRNFVQRLLLLAKKFTDRIMANIIGICEI
jgi:hypothetical protein